MTRKPHTGPANPSRSPPDGDEPRRWLGQLAEKPGVITFYSVTSKVDCSAAVTDVATRLAERGRRVLIINLNLTTLHVVEVDRAAGAPLPRSQGPGLVELLASLAGPKPISWRDCTRAMRPIPQAPEIHVLEVRPDALGNDPATPLFERLFEHRHLGHKLEALRAEWLTTYDVVLVVSPPGLNAIAGLSVINLPDVVVTFFTGDQQTISSTRHVLRRAIAEHTQLPLDRTNLIAIPVLVQSHRPADEVARRGAEELAARELNEFFTAWLSRSRDPIDAIRLLSRTGDSPESADQDSKYECLASLLDGQRLDPGTARATEHGLRASPIGMAASTPVENQRLKVLILEDHRIVRESLTSALEMNGLEVVGAYADAPSFLSAARRRDANVALVDILLEDPTLDGLSVLQALPGIAPNLRSVVLSASHDPVVVERAYQLGACAYLHKLDSDCASIISALRAATRGEGVAERRAFEDALYRPPSHDAAAGPLGALTHRERDVLECVASGADNMKIAALLEITERTVRAHVSSLYRKLGPENRAELAIFARDLGVTPRSR